VSGLLLFLLKLLPKHKRRRFFLAKIARQNDLLLHLSLFGVSSKGVCSPFQLNRRFLTSFGMTSLEEGIALLQLHPKRIFAFGGKSEGGQSIPSDIKKAPRFSGGLRLSL